MANPNAHLEYLCKRIPVLEACDETILDAFDLLITCFESHGKLLLCGNGGSAADAEHISAELLKGFLKKRKCPDALALPEGLQMGLPAIPLPSFTALTTAFSNDVSADYIFAQLVLALRHDGDALFAISTSGNAANVCWACKTARALDMPVIGLTGKDGGELKHLSDVCIRVPASATFEIQELHLPVYHCLCAMLEERFFGPDA